MSKYLCLHAGFIPTLRHVVIDFIRQGLARLKRTLISKMFQSVPRLPAVACIIPKAGNVEKQIGMIDGMCGIHEAEDALPL